MLEGIEAFKNYKYRDLIRLVKNGKPAKPYSGIKKIYSDMDKRD